MSGPRDVDVQRLPHLTDRQRTVLLELQSAEIRRRVIHQDSRFAAVDPAIAASHAEVLRIQAETRGVWMRLFAQDQPYEEAEWIPPEWFLDLAGVTYAVDYIDGTRVLPGDVLEPYARRGGYLCLPLLRSELAVLRDLINDEDQLLHVCEGRTWAEEILLDRRTWRSKRPVLYVVRPVRREEVLEPIAAESDQAAIFELLYQVGGRMPEGRGRKRRL